MQAVCDLDGYPDYAIFSQRFICSTITLISILGT